MLLLYVRHPLNHRNSICFPHMRLPALQLPFEFDFSFVLVRFKKLVTNNDCKRIRFQMIPKHLGETMKMLFQCVDLNGKLQAGLDFIYI